jgi:hypothetical protein
LKEFALANRQNFPAATRGFRASSGDGVPNRFTVFLTSAIILREDGVLYFDAVSWEVGRQRRPSGDDIGKDGIHGSFPRLWIAFV